MVDEKKTAKHKMDEITEGDARSLLSKKGYTVLKPEPTKGDRVFTVDKSLFTGRTVKFAVVGCTQIGSKYQQMTHLTEFYKIVEDMGIKCVLHGGDMMDGEGIYKGQVYELFLHGADAQIDYTVEYYPKIKGGKTFVISGNHDLSFMAEAGIDTVNKVAEKRKDIEYLGAIGAYPNIKGLNIYLQHGAGGVAYARSYKLQKQIEQFAPEVKPDYYFLAHYHINCMLPQYRNVFGMTIPCFQSQTPYLKRKNLYPEVGGWVFEFKVNDKGRKNNLVLAKMQYIPFFNMIESDYS